MGRPLKYSLALAFIGGLFFLPFLGGVHLYDWDEINFAELAREMILTGDYLRPQINFEPFWQKPPLFIWMQVLSMKSFGIGEYAARLPNAICGMLTLVILFNMGRVLHSVRFGVLWAGAYFGSILPFLYFKSGIIDPWFNLFIFLGLYQLIVYYWKQDGWGTLPFTGSKWINSILAGAFVGLGVLTKGPVAFLLVVLTLFVYWIIEKGRFFIKPLPFTGFVVVAVLVAASWFGIEMAYNGSWFVKEFTTYQIKLLSTPDAGHEGFFGYHFVVLLVGCFPASVFCLKALIASDKEGYLFQFDFRRWMIILLGVVLVLFSIVQSKIVHYSSLAYFPLTYLAAVALDELVHRNDNLSKWTKMGLIGIGGVYVVAVCAAPFVSRSFEWIIPFVDNEFVQGNLVADVNWSGWEIIPGIIFAGIIAGVVLLFSQKKTKAAIGLLLSGTAIFTVLSMGFFANKIEGYSQNAAIEFYKSKRGEKCIILPIGFKSYAHLFYAEKQPITIPNNLTNYKLLQGRSDITVYAVSKIQKYRQVMSNYDVKEIGRKNGFVFFEVNKQRSNPE